MDNKYLNILKKNYKTYLFVISVVLVGLISYSSTKSEYENTLHNKALTMVRTKEDDAIKAKQMEVISEKIQSSQVAFDGLTIGELEKKLNKNLNSTLSGKGKLIAEYSTELGLDPYLAVAIMLHETGCNWSCSGLVKQCNNVGGQKGGPSCGGTSYRSYPTLDEGIKGMMDNLYYNYYAKGLTTPEQINKAYAESTTWATKINSYMNKIKAS